MPKVEPISTSITITVELDYIPSSVDEAILKDSLDYAVRGVISQTNTGYRRSLSEVNHDVSVNIVRHARAF